jgi:hypothetical protein
MSQVASEEITKPPTTSAVTSENPMLAGNAALLRLATAVRDRNTNASTVNYSRMHHRHARSHTRA